MQCSRGRYFLSKNILISVLSNIKTTGMKLYLSLLVILSLTICGGCKQKTGYVNQAAVDKSENDKHKMFLDDAVLDTIKQYFLKRYDSTCSSGASESEVGKLKVTNSDSTLDFGYYIHDTVKVFPSRTTTIPRLKKNCLMGDLNNDNLEDLVVSVKDYSGGNAVTTYLFVFTNSNGKYHLTDVKTEHDLCGCRSDNSTGFGSFIPHKIEGGNLVGESYCYLEEDASCCPSLHYRAKVSLQNGKLVVSQIEKFSAK